MSSSRKAKSTLVSYRNESTLPVLRLLDVNLNRAREGLRVIEDVSRFVLNNQKDSLRLKQLRHRLNRIAVRAYPDLISARDVKHDLGRLTHEKGHHNLNSVVRANFRRSQEALRVLEEYARIISTNAAGEFKKIRYTLYQIEKDVGVVQPLSIK